MSGATRHRRVPFRTLHRRALLFEPLEDRRLLSIFTGIPEWSPVGPAPISPKIGAEDDNLKLFSASGAIGPIAVHPIDPDILYIGSVNGGVWKTDNARYSRNDGIDNDNDGTMDELDLDEVPHWKPLTDDFSTPIGALVFDPIDPSHETLWTGNARFSSLNRSGVPRGGLLRTTDGGETWDELGTSTFQNLDVENILATGISTPNGQLVLAATIEGVYRSDNGGQDWAQVLVGNATGLVSDPTNSDRFFAAVAGQGVFRSATCQADHADCGKVWNNVSSNDTDLAAKVVGTQRIGLAATSAGSGAVFAATVSGGVTGVFQTTTGGTSWNEIDVPTGRTTVVGANAGLRHFAFAADPNHQHRVYVAGFRTIAIGDAQNDSWSLLNPIPSQTPPGYLPLDTNGNLHDDVRGLAIDRNGNIVTTNDGGVYRIVSPFVDAQRFTESINGDLQITETNSQFSLAYDSLNNVVVLGTQDNGTVVQTAGSSRVFAERVTGDGNSTAVEVDAATSTSVRYVTDNNWKSLKRLKYNDKNQLLGSEESLQLAVAPGGARYSGLARGNDARVSSNNYSPGFPFVLNEVTPARLLLGTGNGLYESTDRGDTVRDITPGAVDRRVTAVAYGGWQAGSPNADIIYAGADNLMWLRTSTSTGFGQLSSYNGSRPQEIVLHPLNWQEAYVLDSNSRIWRTFNAGQSWNDVTAGADLPPLRSIEFASIGGTSVLLAGGDGGVFRLLDPATATSWSEFGRGLPNVIVQDVVYDETDRVLIVGTVGRGVWMIEDADKALPIASTLTVRGDLTDDGKFQFPNRDDVIRIAQNPIHDDWLDIFVNDIDGIPEYSVEHASVQSIVIHAEGGNDFLQIDFLPPNTSVKGHGGPGRDVFYVASDDVESLIEMFGDADADWFRVTPNLDADIVVTGGAPDAPVAEGDSLSVITGGQPFANSPGPQAGEGMVHHAAANSAFNPIRYVQSEDVSLDGSHWRPDIWESNDTFSDAADLVAGTQTETNLTIHDALNDDWFQWTATGGDGNLLVQLFFDDELGDLDLALLSAGQSVLVTSTTTSDDESVVWNAVEGQTYYLRVYGFNGATHPNYTLKISWPNAFPDDSFEQNDTFSQAADLMSGDQTHRNLAVTPIGEFTSDEDWYRWQASADGALTVDAKFLHALGNLELELYSSSQVLLDSSTSTDDNERVTTAVSGGQRYYIRVYGFAGFTHPNYELAINGPEAVVDALYGDGNNAAAKAKHLGAGELTIAGLSIHQPAEDDWFVWRADADSALTVRISFDHELGDLDLELLDDNLAQLDASRGTGDEEQVTFDVDGGQSYFMRVYGFSGATNYDYTLDITWPPPIPQDPLEPNDLFAESHFVGSGDQLHEGLTIHPVGEFQSSDDWYRWTAPTDGLVELSISFLDAPGDLDLAFYDSSQALLTSATSSTDNEVIRWQVQAAQDYFIRVYGFGGARNAHYDLVIDGPDILLDVFEPNNSRLDAYNLGMGDHTYEGLTLHAPNNEDWYEWTAPIDGTLAVGVEFTHAWGDIDVHLYNEEGGLLDSSTSSGDAEQVSTPVTAGNRYFVRVFGFNNATNPFYDLLIDGPPVLPDGWEPNDTQENATELTSDNQTLAPLTIHQPGNSDWFAWTAQQEGTLTARVTFADQLGDVDLELYDSGGNVLAHSSTASDVEQISWQVNTQSTYYLRVFGAVTQYVPRILRGSTVTIQADPLSSDYTLETSFIAAPTLLIGDYNRNGIVDTADYTVWRDTLHSTSDLRADGSGNGTIDQSDYDLWKANYGDVSLEVGSSNTASQAQDSLRTPHELQSFAPMLDLSVVHSMANTWPDAKVASPEQVRSSAATPNMSTRAAASRLRDMLVARFDIRTSVAPAADSTTSLAHDSDRIVQQHAETPLVAVDRVFNEFGSVLHRHVLGTFS